MKFSVKKVEIELTNRCNAACPGCRRTFMLNKGQDLTYSDLDENLIYDNFSDIELKGVCIKLCGVLGDPLVHPKMFEITKWFAERGAHVQISTNASLRNDSYWYELGTLSALTKNVSVNFAVDGLEETNHVYRVNTSFERIKKNMRAYSDSGGQGHWIFIEFDHNAHQKDEARQRSEKLGFPFYVRRAVKNSVSEWLVAPKKTSGNKEPYKVVKNQTQAHQGLADYKKILHQEVYAAERIICKLLHEGEFFLASDTSVWPCCFLWDEFNSDKSNFSFTFKEKFSPLGWNRLATHNFGKIFSHRFYSQLEEMWKPESPVFQKRCHLSCGAKGNLRNSFTKD